MLIHHVVCGTLINSKHIGGRVPMWRTLETVMFITKDDTVKVSLGGWVFYDLLEPNCKRVYQY